MPRTARDNDVIKFLQMMNSEHSDTGGAHQWRKCPRCLALARLTDHDPLAEQLIARAIELLQAKG